MQNPNIVKAKETNPSYESFAPHEQHESKYHNLEDRPSTHMMSTMRRYPNGELDYVWASNAIIDAIHKAEYNGFLTPMEEALLTVVFPLKFRKMEPMMAEIRTQLSRTEKSKLKQLVMAHLAEEVAYNAGSGGVFVPGQSRTLSGK